MTFLNPAVLIGLAAASIPIIIHLLNLRNARIVEFSSLRFLRELQRTTLRRIRLRQWLLLLLRTLIVALLVLAFARPAMKGALSSAASVLGSSARSTMVIALDDTPSMNVRGDLGVRFDMARKIAQSVYSLSNAADDVYLIRFSDARRQEHPTPSLSGADFQAKLERSEVTEESVPLYTVLGTARKALQSSPNVNNEIYILSDLQQSSLFASDAGQDSSVLFDERLTVFLGEVGADVANAGIVSATNLTSIVTMGKPVHIEASVLNASSARISDMVLSAYLDGSRVAQKSVSAAPFSTVTVELAILPQRRGAVPGHVQIEEDNLEIDNRRHFIVSVPEKIDALIVGQATPGALFSGLALTSDADSAGTGMFSITRAPEDRLSATDLEKFDLLLLEGVRDFTPTEVERVLHFAAIGGGVLIAPGHGSDIDNYNGVLFPKLGLPRASLRGTADNGDSSVGFISFGRIDFDHPIFAGIFETPGTGTNTRMVESPRIARWLGGTVGTGGNAIISLTDGSPFLSEYRHGRGTIALIATELGLSWSDLPRKGVFVPLLYRSALYLAGTGDQLHSYLVGEPIRMFFRSRHVRESDNLHLKSPSAIEESVVRRVTTAGSLVLDASPPRESGIHTLHAGTGKSSAVPVNAIAVNINPAETDLRPATTDELHRLWKSLGILEKNVYAISNVDRLQQAVHQARFGIELWKHCILLAVICAIAEMLIARIAREEQA